MRPASLDAVRAAVLAEAARPRVTWRRRVLVLLALNLATLALVTAAGALAGKLVTVRVLGLAPLLAAQVWLAFSAAKPGAGFLRVAGVFGASIVAVLLVSTRGDAEPHSNEWRCAALHLAAALPGLLAGFTMLRTMAPSLPRALCVGLSVGVTGAALGELMCPGDAVHVAAFHLSAWLAVACATVLLSARLRRDSWAP